MTKFSPISEMVTSIRSKSSFYANLDIAQNFNGGNFKFEFSWKGNLPPVSRFRINVSQCCSIIIRAYQRFCYWFIRVLISVEGKFYAMVLRHRHHKIRIKSNDAQKYDAYRH